MDGWMNTRLLFQYFIYLYVQTYSNFVTHIFLKSLTDTRHIPIRFSQYIAVWVLLKAGQIIIHSPLFCRCYSSTSAYMPILLWEAWMILIILFQCRLFAWVLIYNNIEHQCLCRLPCQASFNNERYPSWSNYWLPWLVHIDVVGMRPLRSGFGFSARRIVHTLKKCGTRVLVSLC